MWSRTCEHQPLRVQWKVGTEYMVDSPWSVNSKSVKTKRFDLWFHLSLKVRELLTDVLPSVWSHCQCVRVHLYLLPWLWDKGNCCFYRLLWRTPGGTVRSLLTWQARQISVHSRDQRGRIHPKIKCVYIIIHVLELWKLPKEYIKNVLLQMIWKRFAQCNMLTL